MMFEVCIKVPFKTKQQAEIVYNTLNVDNENQEMARLKTSTILTVKEHILHAQIKSELVRKLRATVTNFMDQLILVVDTIADFEICDDIKTTESKSCPMEIEVVRKRKLSD